MTDLEERIVAEDSPDDYDYDRAARVASIILERGPINHDYICGAVYGAMNAFPGASLDFDKLYARVVASLLRSNNEKQGDCNR